MSQSNSQLSGNETSAGDLPAKARVGKAELELGCINLISQLEMHIASTKSRSSHVENASSSASKVLTVLLDFCDEFLTEEATAGAKKDIEKAGFASLALKEVLDSLGWGFAISNLFGKSVESDPQVRETYQGLGESLLAACVSVLRQAVLAVGFDSETGKSIEQSTAVFVEEFRSSW